MSKTGRPNSFYITCLFGFFLIPFLTGWFLQESSAGGQHNLFLVLLMAVVISMFMYAREASLNKSLRFTWGVFLLVLSSLLISIMWNRFYLHLINQSGFRSDVFREPVQTLHAPLYGLSQLLNQNRYAFIITVVLFFVISWILILPKLSFRYAQFLLMGLQALFLVAFCFTDGMPRFEKQTVHFATFHEGLPFFKDVPDLLLYYVSTMGRMGVHNDHYPPGNLILLLLEKQSGNNYLVVPLLFLLIILSTFYIEKTLQLFQTGREQILFTQALFLTAGNVLIYSSIDFSAIPVFLIATGVYWLLRYIQHPDFKSALYTGGVLSIYLFFSFTVSLWILFLFFFLTISCLKGFVSMKHILYLAVAIFILNLVIYYSLFRFSGFDMAGCFQKALFQSRQLLKSNPFDDGNRYIIRSSGNLLGFVLGSGMTAMALCILTFAKEVKTVFGPKGINLLNNSMLNLFPTAFVLLVLFASFSGLFFLETERIWTCFLPLLAISSGISFDYFSKPQRSILIISAIFTACILELCWSQI